MRALTEEDLAPAATLAAAEVNRLGVVNYFDRQRFGSLKHGQGFIAKDLMRGDFEAALQQLPGQALSARSLRRREGEGVLARALGRLDRARALRAAHKSTTASCRRSARSPRTTCGRSSRSTPPTGRCCSSPTRATSGTRGCGGCSSSCCRASGLFPLRYQAGTCSFTRTPTPDAALSARRHLPAARAGLDVRAIRGSARRWSGCWARRSSRWTSCASGRRRLLYFKHEERPLLVLPGKLVARAAPSRTS